METTIEATRGTSEGDAEPISGERGASILGPRNPALEAENPSLLLPPETDAGTIPNLKFGYAQARNRVLSGGWGREITTRELPIAKELARREHEAEAGRHPRDALAQRGRVGLHDRRQRPGHGHRRRGRQRGRGRRRR